MCLYFTHLANILFTVHKGVLPVTKNSLPMVVHSSSTVHQTWPNLRQTPIHIKNRQANKGSCRLNTNRTSRGTIAGPTFSRKAQTASASGVQIEIQAGLIWLCGWCQPSRTPAARPARLLWHPAQSWAAGLVQLCGCVWFLGPSLEMYMCVFSFI